VCVCVCVVCISTTSDARVGAQGRDGESVRVPTGLSPRALLSVAPCSTSPRPRAQERPWEESLKSQCPISFAMQGKYNWDLFRFFATCVVPTPRCHAFRFLHLFRLHTSGLRPDGALVWHMNMCQVRYMAIWLRDYMDVYTLHAHASGGLYGAAAGLRVKGSG
jgi:hypothetical protein